MGLLTIILIGFFLMALVYILIYWSPNMHPFVRSALYFIVVLVLLYVILSLLGLAPALTR